MRSPLHFLLLGLSTLASTVYADNAAIVNVNNQAFIDGNVGYRRLTYGSDHPGDAGAPLYNAHVDHAGGVMGVTKTVGRIYSQFALGASHTTLHYADSSALIPNGLTDGSAYTSSFAARLGYSFYPCPTQTAITPYVLGAYVNSQMNTGGYSTPYIPAPFNGTTFITQAFYVGLGLQNQWAVTPRWVLNADAVFGTQINPTVSGNVNNFNNQPGAVTTYQQWKLANETFWQVGVGSDYVVTKNTHFRTNVSYGQNKMGNQNTAITGYYPSQKQRGWTVGVGFGYNLAAISLAPADPLNCDTAIAAVNNQANVQLGYQWQSFHGGTTANSFDKTNNVPTLGIVLSKTWQAFYTQLALKEGVGTSSYQTQNTYTDVIGKLGYQFEKVANVQFIPYAALGYHRWLQNVSGDRSTLGFINNIPITYYTNGMTTTYQHAWYGLGLLTQWALSPNVVINLDGNIGRTFDANMHGWIPVYLPLKLSYKLGNDYSQMMTLGVDYSPFTNWHLQTNVQYYHFNYNAGDTNVGITSLHDCTHQWNANVGVGYSFA